MDQQIIPQQNISISGVPGTGEITIYQYFTASPYFAGFDSYANPERKIFLTSFRDLPSSLREFIASDITASTIFSVGQSNDLDDNQIYVLAKSIRELVLGKIFIKEFSFTISSQLGIDDIKASTVVNDIVSKSFGPIMEDLKRIQRSKFPEKIMQLQKEGRPTGLNQAKPPVQASPTPSPQQSPQTPRLDIRPPVTEIKPLDSKPLDSVQNKPALSPQKPPTLGGEARPEGRQFKIPNLGQPVTKENGNKTPGSLEEELEKVANVIDLRSNPKE